MNIWRFLFGRQGDDREVRRKLDEAERQVVEQERRLARISHLRRERALYEKRRESPG